MPILTLTTDFGLKDGFVGVMKGVIWGICPEARIADLSHSVAPQNVLEGAFVLARACPFFPPGTVHLAVVDPGVGTERRPLAARLGDHFFVGPDNGLFTPVIEATERKGEALDFVHLTNPRYWLPDVSRTFHGRDLFAPVAAHLAGGVPLAELGPAITDPVRIPLPHPEKTASGWNAHVTGVDSFGNLTTDLPASALERRERVLFRLLGREVRGLVDSYGHEQPGALVALADSQGFVEIAAVNGSAAQLLGAQAGDVVEVLISG